MLYTISELLTATGGTARHLDDLLSVSSVVIDSRDVPAGALFVPIAGDRFDGHQFARKAAENGAALSLISAEKSAEFEDLPAIIVDDPLAAMRRLAVYARQRSNARIVGVTGSVGKTSTKEALKTVLSAFGKVHASIKSYNNHWGVPLMVANLPTDAKFGVFEMGMNHSGEITPLTQIVRPHVAMITAIAPAHIGELGSMQAIADAKAEIFAGLEPGGTVILNADHEFVDYLVNAATTAGADDVLTYGLRDAAIVLAPDAKGHNSGHFELDGREREISLGVPGAHLLVNGLGAVLVARSLGLDVEKSIEALQAFQAPQGRGETHNLGSGAKKIQLIDESYNANPASMAAALRTFAALPDPIEGRRVLVLGDMKELGDQSASLHAALLDDIAATKPDLVHLVGPEISVLVEPLASLGIKAHAYETVDLARAQVIGSLAYGDMVMLKGSLSTGLGQLVTAIRETFA